MTQKNQKGIALISVLFIFVLATTITVAMIGRQALDIKRAQNILNYRQAYQYSLGAESFARQILYRQAQLNSTVDHKKQIWATPRSIEIENGTLVFRIEDLAGKFNLNSLADGKDAAKIHLVRLCKSLEIPSEIVEPLTARIMRQPLEHVSEILLLPEMSQEDYYKLRPYVSALPYESENKRGALQILTQSASQAIGLNVNTASDKVLAAYLPNEKDREKIYNLINQKGYVTSAELNSIGTIISNLAVRSNYFLVVVRSDYNGSINRMSSTIKRTVSPDGTIEIKVIARDFSPEF